VVGEHAKAKLWEAKEDHNTIYGGYQVDGNEEVFPKMCLDHIWDVKASETEEMKGRGAESVFDQVM
jgi:hypothetical protein